MKTATIQFTEEEAQALINLLDLGVKAGGINWAMSAAILANKIGAATFVEPPLKTEENGTE